MSKRPFKQTKEDNIIILVDNNKCPKELEDYLWELIDDVAAVNYSYFKGDFSEWKNMFFENKDISEELKDYLFFLDTDELPNPELVEQLPYILEINPDVDVFGLPRTNFVEGIILLCLDRSSGSFISNKKTGIAPGLSL